MVWIKPLSTVLQSEVAQKRHRTSIREHHVNRQSNRRNSSSSDNHPANRQTADPWPGTCPETFEVHGQRQLAIPLIRRVATIVFEGLCSRETRSTVPESEVSSTAIRVGPCLNPKMPVLQSERSRT
jgi:hypothetical protein